MPCLILRDRTEWLEAVASSAGRMVLVGLDSQRAVGALAALASSAGGVAMTTLHDRGDALRSSGAAEAIATCLA